ncbi:MAG: hypothetical protein PHU85_20285, partial [Phycisphaerae bacterium]|nr:hypothetical protein [Phycisphaerae bacterium]
MRTHTSGLIGRTGNLFASALVAAATLLLAATGCERFRTLSLGPSDPPASPAPIASPVAARQPAAADDGNAELARKAQEAAERMERGLAKADAARRPIPRPEAGPLPSPDQVATAPRTPTPAPAAVPARPTSPLVKLSDNPAALTTPVIPVSSPPGVRIAAAPGAPIGADPAAGEPDADRRPVVLGSNPVVGLANPP